MQAILAAHQAMLGSNVGQFSDNWKIARSVVNRAEQEQIPKEVLKSALQEILEGKVAFPPRASNIPEKARALLAKL